MNKRHQKTPRFAVFALLAALIVAAAAQQAECQVVSEAPPLLAFQGLESAPPSSHGLRTLLTEMIRSHIPVDYNRSKDWGKTKEFTRGLKIRREGLRITTKRRRKAMNHGTWKRYHIHLIDPEESLRVRVENYVEQEDHRVAFDLVVDAKLDAFGRMAQWERGVQLISLSALAYSEVTLRVRCDVGLVLDATRFPPDVVLDPKVKDADLQLKEFRLRELSNLKGPLAKALSSSVREILEDVIETKRKGMVVKLNAKIDKSRDKLRLSFSEMLKTPWADKIQDVNVGVKDAAATP